ncbi:hypothetical protein BJX61DRAFT_265300 [Aspergillus egyptiacus]|nr:hypothetical protein BJX61DRAFT_265300 [Aspergillus egyptiacus]
MQSLVLPSFAAQDFPRHRFSGLDHKLTLSRSANAGRCTPRDLPIPCSMSSSAPADYPLDKVGDSRLPGRDVQQKVTTAAIPTTGDAVAPPTAATSSAFASNHEPALHRIVSAPGDETLRQPVAFRESFRPSRLSQSSLGPESSQPLTATYTQPTFGSAPVGPASRPLPQKTTRRTKAHVASACVNCKKKHLGCDPARPCRRCVMSGKQDTCVDVTHKKRGRPPLKADEGSIRTYTTQLGSRGPGDQGAQSRRPIHRATSSRELRPITDLQLHGPQPGTMGMRLFPRQARWPPVYPHGMDPPMATQRTMGHRRFSSSESGQPLATVSPTGYAPLPVGYNPALATGGMHSGVGRAISYSSQGMHGMASPPQYHTQPYGLPVSPYLDNTRMSNRMQTGDSSVFRDPREGFVESPVRLPPIYPSPVTANPQHRPGDPHPTTWSPSQQYPREVRQHQPGFTDPVSPSDQMRQAATDMGYASQLGLASPTERQSQQLPPARTQAEQRALESDDGDSSRPAKRRKMALDDMVND